MMKIHGSYRLRVAGNLLEFDGRGPWNEQAVAQYRRDLEAAIGELPERWAFLGMMHGDALVTPESERALSDAIAWRRSRGNTCCALVIEKHAVFAIHRGQFGRMYERAHMPHAFFENEADARRWLSEQGFSAAADAAAHSAVALPLHSGANQSVPLETHCPNKDSRS